jgi:hypothetical protein
VTGQYHHELVPSREEGVRFTDVEQLEDALAGESYLADRGLAV